MASIDVQNNRSYNLRPRLKVVSSISPRKTSMSRLEKSQIKKAIAAAAKLSYAETEGAGERFMLLSAEEHLKRIKAINGGAIHRPPPPLSSDERARMQDYENLRLANMGLSYLNDPSNGDAKYELVRPVCGRFFLYGPCAVYHYNFEAKLQGIPEAEVQLFFLQVVEKVFGKPKVTRCCSLGSSGSKAAASGLNGCKVCKKVNHPKKGFITR